MPDNYSQWEYQEALKSAWLLSRPVCHHCGHHIQEDRMFDIHGNYYHIGCAEEEFLKFTEDFEGGLI